MNLRKKTIAIISSAILIVTCCVTYVSATSYTGPTSNWSYSNYSHGSYVPKTGNLESWFFDETGTDWLSTKVAFTLDSHNVANILDY